MQALQSLTCEQYCLPGLVIYGKPYHKASGRSGFSGATAHVHWSGAPPYRAVLCVISQHVYQTYGVRSKPNTLFGRPCYRENMLALCWRYVDRSELSRLLRHCQQRDDGAILAHEAVAV